MPGRWHDPISCLVRHENLDEAPFYEPLSYTWGDPQAVETILLAYADSLATAIFTRILSLTTGAIEPNNKSPVATLSVTSNLAGALRQLRNERAPRPIWVDAICIDQTNLQERSEQIQKMWLIYSRAPVLVTIWLGELQDEAAKAANLTEGDMRSAWSYLRVVHEKHLSRGDGDCKRAWEGLWDAESPMNPTVLRALSSLCRRSWFTRIWVLQEHIAARAARILCGDITLDFKTFMRTMIALLHVLELEDPSTLEPSLTVGLHGSVRREFCSPEFSNLPIGERVITMLEMVGARLNATDPRDKIYGLLGFLGDVSGYSALRPDYTKPLNEFWYDLTRFLILETNSLHFLQQPDPGASPSWVVKWERPGHSADRDELGMIHNIIKRYTSVNFSPNGKTLYTKVITLGQVSYYVSVHHSMQHGPEHWRSTMRSLEVRLEGTPAVLRRYRTERNIKLALRDLVIWRMDDSLGRDRSELRERYMMLMGRLPLRSFSSHTDSLSANDVSNLHRKSLPRTLGFLILSSGHLGIFEQGDADANLHDQVLAKVCIFPGARLPFELTQEGNAYRLSRKCQIHGVKCANAKDMPAFFQESEWEDICLA